MKDFFVSYNSADCQWAKDRGIAAQAAQVEEAEGAEGAGVLGGVRKMENGGWRRQYNGGGRI